jgi:hypothetical protein
MDGALRPDLVAVDEVNKTVTIIDVTKPFENIYTAFQAARQEKKKKYAPQAEHYNQQGYSVSFVGALGGLAPTNEVVINHLKLLQTDEEPDGFRCYPM